jgi:exonuclease III
LIKGISNICPHFGGPIGYHEIKYYKEKPVFTWWSYRSKDWTINNRGRRLDHIWTTEALKEKITAVDIYQSARSWEKPSDHVPVTITLTP